MTYACCIPLNWRVGVPDWSAGRENLSGLLLLLLLLRSIHVSQRIMFPCCRKPATPRRLRKGLPGVTNGRRSQADRCPNDAKRCVAVGVGLRKRHA